MFQCVQLEWETELFEPHHTCGGQSGPLWSYFFLLLLRSWSQIARLEGQEYFTHWAILLAPHLAFLFVGAKEPRACTVTHKVVSPTHAISFLCVLAPLVTLLTSGSYLSSCPWVFHYWVPQICLTALPISVNGQSSFLYSHLWFAFLPHSLVNPVRQWNAVT